MIPLSYSSKAMTSLIEWRNGVDRESLHLKDRVQLISKVALTQVALVAVAVFSVFEAVFHCCHSFKSFYNEVVFTQRLNEVRSPDQINLDHFIRDIHLFKSACFTTFWSVSNFFYFNIAHAAFSSYSPNLERSELRLMDTFLDSIQVRRGARYLDPEDIESGALFLVDDVLRGLSPDEIEDFKAVSNILLVTTKAVYLYVAGEKREEPVPVFFKREVRNAINDFRRQYAQQEIFQSFQQIQNYIEDITNVPNQDVRRTFQLLREIASMELQNSALLTNCWQRAIEILEEREEVAV